MHAVLCRLTLIALVAGNLLNASDTRAGEPTQQWFTLTTAHFYVHYYKSIRHDERAAAEKVARVAERCHAILSPIFKQTPSSRTHIVVTDDTDGANGSAQAIPFNIIRVFLTAPGSRSELSDYDDWLTGLIMHEYTHILHMDAIHGLPRIVNAVMGRVWVPNIIQPRWFIEGLAVYQESQRTTGGRLRSSLFDMTLRAHALEGGILRLDQITSNTLIYPRGSVPYLYGAYFIRYIADRYGDKALTKIVHAYGGLPIPYALNRVAKEAVGRTYEQLYKEFSAHLRQRYARQRDAVTKRGITPFSPLTTHGWSVGSGRFSPDGKTLVYLANDGKEASYIRLVDANKTSREKARYPHLGGHTVTFTPDGRHLIYGQGVNWRTYHAYHDLYVRPLGGGQVRRLTHGLRARDPDVSPDGSTVVFATNELGSNDLRTIPFVGGSARVLIKGQQGEQFYRPRFSPDGKQIAVSQWRPGGKRDILLIDVGNGERRYVTDDRALDMDPVFTPDGKKICFSSDRTGIFNLYCQPLTGGELMQLTNVLGGVFGAAFSPSGDRVVYVGFGVRGFDLHQMKLDPARFLRASPYINTRRFSRGAPAVVSTDFPIEPQNATSRPYSPLRTLYPRSWLFNVGTDAFGTSVGLEVSGTDVIGRHQYLLISNVSTSRGYVSYLASYNYNRFWPGLHLDAGRTLGPRGGLMVDGDQRSYVEENFGFGASLSLPVLRIPRHAIRINLGYRLNAFRDEPETEALVLPGMTSPRLPETGLLSGVTASVTYSSVERSLGAISADGGRHLSIGMRVDNEVFGSDYLSTQVTWSWAEYLKMPWLDHHVLAARYAGGVARGDFKRRGFFFIGGFPEQNVIQAVIDQAPLGGAYLRGYAPGTFYGDQYHLLNIEYRAPLWQIERGLSSLPLYFNRIHLAAFADVGHAFFGDFEPDALKVGVGGEALVEFVVGYFVPLTLRIGYARGLMSDGSNEFFTLIGHRF
ncbi:MAG: PD40 domain-containing protein [Deltaproteobacteria bacterium]|nr:PD40 domain-containing protein [Deltaproteobacteria bacterium]